MSPAIQQLKLLKSELERVSPFPFDAIESWCQKAMPIIKSHFNDHFEEFKLIARPPRRYVSLRGINDVADRNHLERNTANGGAKIQQLSSHLDGIIAAEELGTPTILTQPAADSRKVFVVHGRNEAARKAMFTFLWSLGLSPMEWGEMVHATGKGTPYIGEVLETGFRIAQAVVVLFTPDDLGMLKLEFQKDHDGQHERELTGQPRQNVLFEAGMALGLHPDRTIIVQIGALRSISDLDGRHIIRLPDKRNELAQRLKTAGCPVNQTGDYWLTAGDFEAKPDKPKRKQPGFSVSIEEI